MENIPSQDSPKIFLITCFTSYQELTGKAILTATIIKNCCYGDYTKVCTTYMYVSTPPNSEIICGQNVGTKVVCGMVLFFEKKAHLHSNWAGLAVLFSR